MLHEEAEELPNKLIAGHALVEVSAFVLKLSWGPTCANAAGTTVPNRDIAAAVTKAAVLVVIIVVSVVLKIWLIWGSKQPQLTTSVNNLIYFSNRSHLYSNYNE